MVLRGCILLVLCFLSLPAAAQWRRATSPIDLPGYGITAPDGPESVVLNPAAMPFLESWGVSGAYTGRGDSGQRVLRGLGVYAATPVIYGIAVGAGVDSVSPTRLVMESDRVMVSLALGWNYQNEIAIGGAVRFLASGDVRLNGVTTVDLAASWRPTDWLALSLIGRDLLGPRLGGTIDQSIPRSFVLSTALRPFGDRTVTLDFGGVIDEDARIGARVAAEIGVPYVGRAVAALEADRIDESNPDLRVTAGLALDWGMYGVGGGVHMGDGFDSAPGWYVSARIEGAERDGLPQGSYVLEVPLEGLTERGILNVVRILDRAQYDDRIVGVLLRPRGSGIGLAYAQEIRMMLDALQRRGKRVVCHLEDASGSEWYVCASADRILLDPAGGVRLIGPSTELLHLGDLLRNVGVRADFVRIGEWKSAIEQYMNRSETAPSRAQTEAVLDWARRRLVFDTAQDLRVERARIHELIDDGPHLPRQAVRRGIVHALADERDMGAELRRGFGGSYPRERAQPWRMPARWGNRPRIGVVVVDGTMVDGENVDIPILGLHMTGGRAAVRTIERMAADPAVVAIVLRVDSPGGSVLAADQIYRAIVRARRRKPVIASFGAEAASGGYYIGAAAQEIWADPTTITGSIGIWFGKVDFVPLGRMIGATLTEVGRGRHAGATSFYRPFTPEERAILAESVRDWYRMFLRRVAQGRRMRVREVDALGRGRLWMGDQAIDNGLIDHLGGFGAALEAARRAARVGPEVDIEVAPGRPVTLLDYVLGALGIGAAPVDPLQAQTQGAILERVLPELRAALATIVTLRQLGAAAPMALMPQVLRPE